MRVVNLAGMAALLALTAGCSSSEEAPPQRSFAQSGPSTVTVEVNNRNFNRATIIWHTGGTRRRLGVVEGVSTATFTVERFTVPQPVQIEIDQTAGQRCMTRELITDPGDSLYLEIAVSFRDTPGCF